MKLWSWKTLAFSCTPIIFKNPFYSVPACTLMVLSFITACKSNLAQTNLFYALNEHLSNESLGGTCSCNSASHNSKELIQSIWASPLEFYKRTCAQICSEFAIKCQRFQLYPKIHFPNRLSYVGLQQTRVGWDMKRQPVNFPQTFLFP